MPFETVPRRSILSPRAYEHADNFIRIFSFFFLFSNFTTDSFLSVTLIYTFLFTRFVPSVFQEEEVSGGEKEGKWEIREEGRGGEEETERTFSCRVTRLCNYFHRTYIYVYIYMYICVYIHIYIYIYSIGVPRSYRNVHVTYPDGDDLSVGHLDELGVGDGAVLGRVRRMDETSSRHHVLPIDGPHPDEEEGRHQGGDHNDE